MWQEVVVDGILFAFFVFLTYFLTWVAVEVSAKEYECGKEYYGFACVKNCSSRAENPDLPCEQHAGEIGIDLVKNINWMLFFASLLSIFGSVYIIYAFTYYKRLTGRLHLKVICSMAVTDLMFSFKFLFSSIMVLSGNSKIVTDGEFACTLSAWLGQLFGLGSVSWNFAERQSSPHDEMAISIRSQMAEIAQNIFGLPCLRLGVLAAHMHPRASDRTCWHDEGRDVLAYR